MIRHLVEWTIGIILAIVAIIAASIESLYRSIRRAITRRRVAKQWDTMTYGEKHAAKIMG